MKTLTELALSKYQSHLNIIQRLFMLGAMTAEKYQESRESAAILWQADLAEIANLESRQNFLNEVA